MLPSAFSLWYAAFMTIQEFTSIMTTKPSLKLTHEGALKALTAAIDKAQEIGVPQNITIVDEGGNMLAFVRMDGAKFLSIETSKSKALSAASHRTATGGIPAALEMKLAIASGGRLTNAEGGCRSSSKAFASAPSASGPAPAPRTWKSHGPVWPRSAHRRRGRKPLTHFVKFRRPVSYVAVLQEKNVRLYRSACTFQKKGNPEETHADASRRLYGA